MTSTTRCIGNILYRFTYLSFYELAYLYYTCSFKVKHTPHVYITI